MLSRKEIQEYALTICIPLMERTARRAEENIWALKADQVGFLPAFLENFCRPFWGIAPIIAAGEKITLTVEGRNITVFDFMRKTLKKGLPHGEEGSWDKYRRYYEAYSYENQNITELAGLMLGMYFAKETLWNPLPQEEKDLFAKEIYDMAKAAFDHSWPNNHYWFPLFAFTVLKRFGYQFEKADEMLESGLKFLDGLYIGHGWYQDGAFGRFDYYEAWSLHLYPLLWTLIADDSFKDYAEYKEKYVGRTNEFLDFYTGWFDKNGAHVPFGRSLSYRFAACALFPVAVLAGCRIDPSLAGRITAKNIEFFKDNVKNEESDILPEGYLYHAPGVVEGYTSDGGAYWCCKAFLALLLDENHPFWDYEKALLPAEKGSFLSRPKETSIHMLFEGANGSVTMYNNTAQYYTGGRMTHLFGDVRSWYSKFAYHSGAGFACSAADKISIDSMISLMTKDQSMSSHRLGFEDLGYENGILHSLHRPFSNDEETMIETWLAPLDGMHVRVHKVTLAREYYVKEGGFSLGRWDDYKPKKTGKNLIAVENHEYISVIMAVSPVALRFCTEDPQAGYHLYAPLATYPMYITEELLQPGNYIFASACAVGKKPSEMELPKLKITQMGVEIISPGKKIFIQTK